VGRSRLRGHRYSAYLKMGPNSPIPERDFITAAEAAAMMRVSKMTVYRLIHFGELPATRVGQRLFRLPRRAVEAYLGINHPVPPKRED
jgi:excisionase family DNA binding protein